MSEPELTADVRWRWLGVAVLGVGLCEAAREVAWGYDAALDQRTGYVAGLTAAPFLFGGIMCLIVLLLAKLGGAHVRPRANVIGWAIGYEVFNLGSALLRHL